MPEDPAHPLQPPDDHDHAPYPGENQHQHENGPQHGHAHPASVSWRGRLVHRVRPHSHDSADKVDEALEASRDGIRALWVSLLVLIVTAAVQAVVVVLSGSVALLGDTIHNVADALTALPLGLAFLVGRRPPTRRYTYGYGRAEDLAGLAVVLVIALSSALAGYESVRRLTHQAHVSQLGLVAVAAVVGFTGNELVARYRITVGRRIGSAALVADGLHARTDGFTSLAVLVGAAGVAVGWQWADPVVGLVITVAILLVLRGAAREVYRRLMDAVDPALVAQAEHSLGGTDGVLRVGRVRLGWIGHQLHAEAEIELDPTLSLVAAHAIALDAEHRLLHDVPRLRGALIHPDPRSTGAVDHHALTAHHTAYASPERPAVNPNRGG